MYDIQQFLDGGYEINNWWNGLHITFDTIDEAINFAEQIKYEYPNVELGALQDLSLIKDYIYDYGFVYCRGVNRILRTYLADTYDEKITRVIPAMNLMMGINTDDVMNFLGLGV